LPVSVKILCGLVDAVVITCRHPGRSRAELHRPVAPLDCMTTLDDVLFREINLRNSQA
jgi:hypothetical protein